MAWAAADLYEGDGARKSQCSASSEFSVDYPATDAFDGDTGTSVGDCWISSDSNTPEVDGSCWLQWDFAATMFIAGVQIRRRSSSAGEMTNYPKDIVVKAKRADDVDWTTVKTITLSSPADGAWGDEVDFDPIHSTHWDVLRIEFHSVHYRGAVGWNVCVKEVRFRGREKCGELTTYLAANFRGAVVQEYSSGDTAWGYVGNAPANRFAFMFRQHDSRSDIWRASFFWAENGGGSYAAAPAFRMESDHYTYKGTAYLIAVFDKADIDGLYLNSRLYQHNNYSDSFVRIYDGAVDYASDVQFPLNAAFVPPGAAGLLQTVLELLPAGDAQANGLIDVSGATGQYVTVMVVFDKVSDSGNGYLDVFAWNISNLPVLESCCGDAALPIAPFLGSAVLFSGEASLPTFSIVAVCEGGVGYATLPSPIPEKVTNEIAMTAGFALEGTAYRPLLGEAELPAPLFFGVVGGRQNAVLPLCQIEISGVFIGWNAAGNEELPVPAPQGYAGGRGVAELPLASDAEGYAGALAVCVANAPKFGLSGNGYVTSICNGDAGLPAPRSVGTCLSYRWFSGSGKISFALGASGFVGISAAGNAGVDFSLVANGGVLCLGVGDAVSPVPVPVGSVQSSQQVTGLLRFHRGF